MAKSKLVQANEKIAESVVDGYKKIENGVVNGYKKIETGVVEGFTKMTDHFVDQFLTKEGETVAEAKARLAREQAQREERHREQAVPFGQRPKERWLFQREHGRPQRKPGLFFAGASAQTIP